MIVLCADDFGLAPGVSRGIGELALDRRLSATGAMVTFPEWAEAATDLIGLRDVIATGLHLNLTVGRPASGAESLPLRDDGCFPGLADWIARTASGRLDRTGIAEEIAAQIAAFEGGVGALPDFIDGHQHVHALPGVRNGLVDAIARFRWRAPPFVRSPGDRPAAIARRRVAAAKAAAVATLSAGFPNLLKRNGITTNDSFAGFSSFTPGSDFRAELEASFQAAGTCHLVMCHPGHVDGVLAGRDPLLGRREEELEALARWDDLPQLICHPRRDPASGTIDWRRH